MLTQSRQEVGYRLDAPARRASAIQPRAANRLELADRAGVARLNIAVLDLEEGGARTAFLGKSDAGRQACSQGRGEAQGEEIGPAARRAPACDPHEGVGRRIGFGHLTTLRWQPAGRTGLRTSRHHRERFTLKQERRRRQPEPVSTRLFDGGDRCGPKPGRSNGQGSRRRPGKAAGNGRRPRGRSLLKLHDPRAGDRPRDLGKDRSREQSTAGKSAAEGTGLLALFGPFRQIDETLGRPGHKLHARGGADNDDGASGVGDVHRG